MKFAYPEILNETEYKEKMPTILNSLEKIRKITNLNDGDGGTLYCESYINETNDKNIVILHGFTEFGAKYHEMTWYLCALGFNVFIYDQRGHGFSHRQINDLNLIHIDSFNTYIKDLEIVIEKLVKPEREHLPIYLFSHSMGGAVASLYMMKHPETIKKALLCAPMISPKTMNVPRPLVMLMTYCHGIIFGWDKKFKFTGDFNPQVNINNTLDSSMARFQATIKQRITTKEYQSSSATNRWMWEAITVQDKILKKRKAGKISTQILIISAENDTVVKNKYHCKFAKMLKNCTSLTVPCAKHNIFFSSGDTLTGFYTILFDFFS